jgi:hypothetical protein
MWVKDYHTGKYVQLDRSAFVSPRHFYEEWMRIKYNHILVHPNTLHGMKERLQQVVEQKGLYDK